MFKSIVTAIACCLPLFAQPSGGETLFKSYCWGCHHPTAEAFGPSFHTIASKRTKEQIMAMIADPDGTYGALGYRRNSMPAFDDLDAKELSTLADYVLSFKDTKK
jgi:cytochrome c551/c552